MARGRAESGPPPNPAGAAGHFRNDAGIIRTQAANSLKADLASVAIDQKLLQDAHGLLPGYQSNVEPAKDVIQEASVKGAILLAKIKTAADGAVISSVKIVKQTQDLSSKMHADAGC